MGYCYVGEWNGHQFVVEDGVITDRFLIDGKPAAAVKTLNGATLEAEAPGAEGIRITLYVNGTGLAVCGCVVGKPLKSAYNEDTKTYTGEYLGHEVEAVCGKELAVRIDGKQVTEKLGDNCNVIICRGEPDENGKSLVVVFERTTGLRRRCAMFADAEVVKMTVCRKEGEEFVPVPESDDDDTFNAAAWLLLFNMFNN